MKAFYTVLTVIFAVGTLGEKELDKRDIFALCFCVSAVSLLFLTVAEVMA